MAEEGPLRIRGQAAHCMVQKSEVEIKAALVTEVLELQNTLDRLWRRGGVLMM